MNSNIENVFIRENATVKLNNLKLEKTKKELVYNKINKDDNASIIFQINKENTGLPQVLEILLDKDEEYTDEERGKITESLKTVATTTP